MFKEKGPQLTWGFTMILLLSAILPAILFRNYFVPLNSEPKLKSGEFYKFKLGVLYRF